MFFRVKALRKDNKGSAIVMVLVGMAFMIALVSTMYNVTLANVHMKQNDLRIKKSYYTAETVTEQMKAGLEDMASAAFGEIYRQSLSRYNTGSSVDEMTKEYLEALVKELAVETDIRQKPLHYNVEKLKEMVETDLLTAETIDGRPAGVELKLLGGLEGSKEAREDLNVGDTILDNTLEDRVILRDVYVQYTSPDDAAVSIIKTDFTLAAPTGSFAAAPQMPDLFNYSIIARDKLEILPGVDVTSYKSIYAGDNAFTIGQRSLTDAKDDASLTMEDEKGGTYLVSKAPLDLRGLSKDRTKLVTMENTRFYTQDIRIDEASLELNGTAAVADDLTYLGKGDVTIKGSYIGYGASVVNEGESSAVLINHPNAALNAGSAKSFVLAGRAFIGQDSGTAYFGTLDDTLEIDGAEQEVGGGFRMNWGNDPGSNNIRSYTEQSAVPMGRSIAVKSDQVAYLVPPECIGLVWSINWSEYSTVVGINPVPDVTKNYFKRTQDGVEILEITPNFSAYPEMNNNDHARIVEKNVPVESLGGRTLDYFVSKNTENGDRRYAIRYVRGQYGQNLAYFYLFVDESKKDEFLATDYAKQFINEKYFTYYVKNEDRVLLPDNAKIAGSYVTTDGAGRYTEHAAGNFIWGNAEAYTQRYQALCRKLVENYAGLSETELANHIFDNLVERDDMEAYIGENFRMINGAKAVKFAFEDSGETHFGLITMGDYDYGKNTGDENLHFIISKGNVTVNADFDGVIIALGTVSVHKPSGGSAISLKNDFDSGKLSDLINAAKVEKEGGAIEDSPRGKVLADFLKDGYLYRKESTGASAESASGADLTNYSSLVHYENFQKR